MADVTLSTGQVAIVDEADLERLRPYRWHGEQWRSDGSWYAATYHRHGRITMHRLLLDARPGEIIDHINGNGLDNRRSNLRLCSHDQNMHNVHQPSRSKHGYFGVKFDARCGKWIAGIKANNRTRYLGAYDSPEQAAAAYDGASRALFGPNSTLNFRRWAPRTQKRDLAALGGRADG